MQQSSFLILQARSVLNAALFNNINEKNTFTVTPVHLHIHGLIQSANYVAVVQCIKSQELQSMFTSNIGMGRNVIFVFLSIFPLEFNLNDTKTLCLESLGLYFPSVLMSTVTETIDLFLHYCMHYTAAT